MSNQPPSEEPTPSAGLGQPPPGGYPQMDYPPTAPLGPYQGDPYQADPYQAGPYQAGPYQAGPYQVDPVRQPPAGGPAVAPGGPPPRRSNVPIIAVILASTLLLCAGAVVAGVLVVRTVVNSAKEALPDRPTLPTALPTALPTDLPTDLPGLPGWPTDLPTELPELPTGGSGRTVTVGYEVDGDGPADITYLTKTGAAPTTIRRATLPWRLTVSMSGVALASVVAVRTDSSAGSIRCRTTIDGKQVAQRSGEGVFAIAACSKLIFE